MLSLIPYVYPSRPSRYVLPTKFRRAWTFSPTRSPPAAAFGRRQLRGVFATVSSNHDLCSIGIYTHNLDTTPAQQQDLGRCLKKFSADLGYVRPEDIPMIPVRASKPKVVVYGPLESVPLPPDVVLLFVKADQTLILSGSVATDGGWFAAGDGPAGMRGGGAGAF